MYCGGSQWHLHTRSESQGEYSCGFTHAGTVREAASRMAAWRREVQHPPPLCPPCWSWLSMRALGKLRESTCTSVMLCDGFSTHCPLCVPPIDMKRFWAFWVTHELWHPLLDFWSFDHFICDNAKKEKKKKKRTFLYISHSGPDRKTYWGFSNLD